MKLQLEGVMIGNYGKLCFGEKESGKVWNDYMRRIMHEENDWDRNVDGNAVEGRVVCVNTDELLQAIKKLKQKKILAYQKYR